MSYSLRTNKDGLTIDWDEYENDNYLWRPGVWYIMTERGLEKKYKDQVEEEPIKNKRRNRKSHEDNDALEMKIEKQLEEHTSISKKIDYDIEKDVETNSSNAPTYQAGRILFSALSLLRIGR